MTEDLINALKLHPDLMPMDDGCDYMKHLSVNKGVQAVLHIDGSKSLLYLVNPDDGREPYIVIRGPQPSQMMTTRLHREGEPWEEIDNYLEDLKNAKEEDDDD